MSAHDEFHGCRRLIATLDQAVSGNDPAIITRNVEKAFCHLLAEDAITLPEPLRQPASDGYARRLIHRDPQRGYSAIAMVWGPGQGTPVHDHDGLWCVECVLEGRIEITPYALVERNGTRFRLLPQGSVNAGFGSVGRLIPPFEYHTVANPEDDAVAITLHVYGGDMERCNAFVPLADGWYRREERRLGFTA
ncbi:MAG: cysteine dioxygenase [Acidobacteria bacterium]|nr:MAG: cysteine dioxygenase [Acidobacteriota bacterium]